MARSFLSFQYIKWSILFFSPLFAGGQDSLSTQYQHGVNTDLWQGGLLITKETRSGMHLQLRDQVVSSRLVVSPRVDKWKDEHQWGFYSEKIIFPSFSLRGGISGVFFSDHQSGYMKDILRTHTIGVWGVYTPKTFTIPLGIGFKEDSRFGKTDQGISYQMGLRWPTFSVSSYEGSVNTHWEEDHLTPRKNRDFLIHVGVHRQFEMGTADSLTYRHTLQRRDYYVSEKGEIESRREKNHVLSNVLTYGVSSHVQCRFLGEVSSRDLQIYTVSVSQKGKLRERQDFSLHGLVEWMLKYPHWEWMLFFSRRGEEQKYWLGPPIPLSPFSGSSALIMPDNRTEWTSLFSRFFFQFSERDSISTLAHLQKLQYDTPDQENTDDRDELRFLGELKYGHVFSPWLSLQTNVGFRFLHLIYIHGKRSADNHKIRTFRLSSLLSWRFSSVIRMTQAAEVLANYTEYDYEPLFPGIRSFAYRKLSLEDSLFIRCMTHSQLFFQWKLELDENGKLLWHEWLEQKLMDRHSVEYALFWAYTPCPGFLIMPGYTFYTRKGYRYSETLGISQTVPRKDQNVYFHTQGPAVKARYRTKQFDFFLSASATVTRIQKGKKQLLHRMDFGMHWIP